MTKTATDTTRSPLDLVPDGLIKSADMRDVTELLNHVAGTQPTTYLAWAPSNPEEIPDGTTREVCRGWIDIDPDDQAIEVEARGTIDGSTTITVDFTVGLDSASVALTTTGVYVIDTSLLTSGTGTGRRLWTIDVTRSAGAGVTSKVEWYAIRPRPIAATAFPDPED